MFEISIQFWESNAFAVNIRGKSVSYVLDTTFKPCSVFLIYDNEVFAQWEIESDKKFDVWLAQVIYCK